MAGSFVRIRIEIDRDLLSRARQATELSSDEAVVEEGLRLLIRARGQRNVLHLAGKVAWSGDLSASRESRDFDHLEQRPGFKVIRPE